MDTAFDKSLQAIFKLILDNLWEPFSKKYENEIKKWKKKLPVLGLASFEKKLNFDEEIKEDTINEGRDSSMLEDFKMVEQKNILLQQIVKKEKELKLIEQKRIDTYNFIFKKLIPVIIVSLFLLILLILSITVAKWKLNWKG